MALLPDIDNDLLSAVSASFIPETGIVQILLDKVSHHYADKPVHYQDKVFQPRKELHITLISQDAPILTRHLKTYPDDADDIQELVQSVKWTYRKDGHYLYVVRPPGVESIIETVDVPDFPQFLKDLSKLVGHGFMRAPLHVTLYSRGSEKDAELSSQVEFDHFVKGHILPEEVY